MWVCFDWNLGVWNVVILDHYYLADTLVNHIAAYTAPFETFPHDYEVLTTYINTNVNSLSGSQLINHFGYNGGGDLAPYVRQGLIDGIESWSRECSIIIPDIAELRTITTRS